MRHASFVSHSRRTLNPAAVAVVWRYLAGSCDFSWPRRGRGRQTEVSSVWPINDHHKESQGTAEHYTLLLLKLPPVAIKFIDSWSTTKTVIVYADKVKQITNGLQKYSIDCWPIRGDIEGATSLSWCHRFITLKQVLLRLCKVLFKQTLHHPMNVVGFLGHN